MITPFIELRGVEISYSAAQGRRVLAQDVNLTLQPGQIIALSGRSGSGKSSILSVSYGAQTPAAGEVYWFGQKLTELNEKQRQSLRKQKFGYCEQEVQLFDTLTAVQNVKLGGSDTQTASMMLSELGLEQLQNMTVKNFSGGERQRVTVARALAKQPQVLILDEPTSALDFAVAQTVAQLMVAAKERGAGVLCGTHDEVILEIADEVVRL